MKKQLWILALGLCLSPAAHAVTVLNDTFEPDGITAATRDDDAGAGFGLDMQWRPRIASQAGAYSVVDDAVFGNALKFRQTANSLWLLGQFDNDASDGVASGAGSIPVSLGLNLNDSLVLSLKIRVSAAISGTTRLFQYGLLNIPGGPLVSDPGTDATWINPSTGYFCRINETTPALVSTWKQMGSTGTTPYQGAGIVITNLSLGIAGTTAVFGSDTEAHTIQLRLTRVETGVQIDSYWDGTLVSTATDDGSKGGDSYGGPGPYTTFNTIGILYGTGNIDYILDDVKLDMIFVPEPNTAALGLLGLAALLGMRSRRLR
jgi:hypothetical protein